MKRLTHWNGKKYVLTHGMGYGQTRIITDRLAAYENTMLEPDQIDQIARDFKRLIEEKEMMNMLRVLRDDKVKYNVDEILWEKFEQPDPKELRYTRGINIGYVRGAKAVFELVKNYIPQPIYEKLYEEYVKERINEQ